MTMGSLLFLVMENIYMEYFKEMTQLKPFISHKDMWKKCSSTGLIMENVQVLLDHVNSIRSSMKSMILFTNPSARAGYDTRSIFKWSLTGLNSEFSFS